MSGPEFKQWVGRFIFHCVAGVRWVVEAVRYQNFQPMRGISWRMSRHPSEHHQDYTHNMSISRDDTYDHFVRETGVERNRVLNTLHLFRCQGNVKRHKVFLKLLDFPATDDWEHVRNLLQMICNSNCKKQSAN